MHSRLLPPTAPAKGRARANGWRPIRSLHERHRGRLLRHLLELSDRDRYLRFGYPANDAHIQAFVQRLDFERDAFFGVYDSRLALVGTAHLAVETGSPATPGEAMAEFAVSVSERARGQGLGQLLFDHAVQRARSRGIERLFIHALSENTAMLRIARRAGAEVERHGSESEAWLQLPAASRSTRWSLRVAAQAAAVDYQWKLQRRIARRLWALLHELRQRLAGQRGIASH
jgi:GNAT superfamily N-acetyltransferase